MSISQRDDNLWYFYLDVRGSAERFLISIHVSSDMENIWIWWESVVELDTVGAITWPFLIVGDSCIL